MLFEQLERTVPHAQGLIVTTFPRGTLQIAQPARVPDHLLRAYSKQFHHEDRLTWKAILGNAAVPARDAFGGDADASRYFGEFLTPFGLRHAAAAPLRSPVIEGFAGAVHLYRTADQGEFTAADLKKLGAFAEQVDVAVARQRAGRRVACERAPRLTSKPEARQFLFDGELRPVASDASAMAQLDEQLQDQLREHGRKQLTHAGGGNPEPERLLLPDSAGELWTFRMVAFSSHPAVDGGPCVIFSIQPDCCDWAALRQGDLQADAEVARLVPALKFMQQEFRRSPSLGEIARTVHLSPFHFHRRFAELFGLTPKHFLLECQINDAKRELVAREKDLAQLATDCGFAHQSHFTSRFKQATGLTPTRWRRQALDVAQEQETD